MRALYRLAGRAVKVRLAKVQKRLKAGLQETGKSG